jgi:hypothetical protein
MILKTIIMTKLFMARSLDPKLLRKLPFVSFLRPMDNFLSFSFSPQNRSYPRRDVDEIYFNDPFGDLYYKFIYCDKLCSGVIS